MKPLRRHGTGLGLPWVGALFLAGCATSPITGVVRAPSAPKSPATVAAATPTRCRFQVAAIEDLRDEKGLGRMGPRLVEGPELPGWLGDGLAQIPGYAADAAPIQLHVQVLKAYIRGVSSMKNANLVVRVRMEAPGQAAVVRNYRGVDNSMNWANGEGEMQEAFNRALVDLTRQLEEGLKAVCKS